MLLRFLCFILIFSCDDEKPQQWFKGNTHAHTTMSDGDTEPHLVAKWYLENDYHFAMITDHYKFVDPDTIKLPENRRKDFILIPGEEVTGPKIIHSTSMNIVGVVVPDGSLENPTQILQDHVDKTRHQKGWTILNHPNFYYAINANQIFPVRDLYMFELYNGHPAVNNWGDSAHVSTEEIWDDLLTRGMKIYGVASDDVHHFKKMGEEYANYGRGWVMVESEILSRNAITEAMRTGKFYASSGVYLKSLKYNGKMLHVEIDEEKTRNEIMKGQVIGRKADLPFTGFFIQAISEGDIIDEIEGLSASLINDHSRSYLRIRIVYRYEHPQRGIEEIYAWSQPIFNH
jgi:hypothetical protein